MVGDEFLHEALELGIGSGVDARPYLAIKEWGVKEIEADPEQIGMAGSPTKVKTIVNVAFQAKEARRIDAAADAELEGLVKELIADHIIG